MGYAKAYPSVFGLSTKSTLVKECNKATCDWWTHPENKCLKKKPLLKNVQKCMKTFASYPGELYPYNDAGYDTMVLIQFLTFLSNGFFLRHLFSGCVHQSHVALLHSFTKVDLVESPNTAG